MSASDSCHFQPGQFIECIDDEWFDGLGDRPAFAMPMSGCIYTVVDLKDYFGGIFLQIQGFRCDVWFSSLHFRPVQTPDIGVFRSLLAPTPALTREAELA